MTLPIPNLSGGSIASVITNPGLNSRSGAFEAWTKGIKAVNKFMEFNNAKPLVDIANILKTKDVSQTQNK